MLQPLVFIYAAVVGVVVGFGAGHVRAAEAPAPAADHAADILIRGGTIVDGTGQEPYVGDVAIRGERIVAVGDLRGWEAGHTIDATGLHVAPGFIDAHSHAEDGLRKESLSAAHALLAQGITTAVVNPDGGGPPDVVAQREAMEKAGIGVNVMQLIGHNRVRTVAMRGGFHRPPTDEELQKMREMVRSAMEAGAFGLSSGLFYTPGSFSKTDEVVALAQIAAEYDGVHTSHIRSEGSGLMDSVQELIEISRQTGVTGIVTHIKASGPGAWGKSRQVIDAIALARAQGLDIWADQYPYEASSTSMIAVLVPAWARTDDDGGLRKRLEDAETASRIRAEIAESLGERGRAERIMLRSPAEVAGKTLAEVAAARQVEPADAAIALIREGHSPGVISFSMNEEDVAAYMRQPFTVTSTDGGLPAMDGGLVHPRTYGAFARKLSKYVRDEGVLDLPTAIARMSGTTARVFRLADRGTLRPGQAADIVVFDLNRVNAPATFKEPHQLSEGMVHVLVNGMVTIDGGEFTDAKPGKVLRHGGKE